MPTRLLALAIVAVVLLSSCSHLLFQPTRHAALNPNQLGLNYQTLKIPTSDGLILNSWLLQPKDEHVGNVIFFHGNAENISTHIANVYWLAEFGYQVLLVDYRGFGASQGVATLEGALEDIEHSIFWFFRQGYGRQKPSFVFGQSLGAAMSIYALANNRQLTSLMNGFIVEASFANYQQIAQEALGSHWLTWLFQYPLSWTITNEYSPEAHIHNLSHLPLLLIHSKEDLIVGYHHAEQLIKKGGSQLQHLSTSGGHIQSFQFADNRKVLLNFMAKHANQ